MRRGIAIFAAAGLSMTLAACGSDTTTTEETSGGTETSASEDTSSEDTSSEDTEDTTGGEGGAKLVVWTDSNREAAVTDAASSYEEATGNTVEVVVKEFDDIRADFNAQVPTGEGPDITVGAHDWLGEFYANGVVAPVELGGASSEFNQVAIDAFTYEGQVYGLPYAIENIAMIRNADLVDNTPATFDEMIEAGKAAGTTYPFLIQTGAEGDPYTYYPFQTSFGAPVFNQNDDGSYSTELGLGGDAGKAYAEWLAAKGEKGEKVLDTNINYDVAIDAFRKGESPYIVGGPWMIQEFADAGINLAVDPIPAPGDNPAQPFVGVQGFYISAQAANPIAANDFLINYMGTEETQIAIYEAGNRTPALTSAAESISSDPLAAGFAKVAEGAVPMPSIPEMGSVWAFWGVTEGQIISGAAEPAAAWEKMVSDIEAELSK